MFIRCRRREADGSHLMQYLAIIEQGPTSFGAYLPDLPGCVAVGDTREEVIALITEAAKYHLELMSQHSEDIPEPTSAAIEVEVQVPAPAHPC